MKRFAGRGRRIAAVAVSAGLLATAVGLSGTGPAGAAAPAQSKGSKGKVTIEVGDNFYEPDDVEVTAGTRVTWKNEGKILHNVVPVKKAKWGTRALAKGKTYSYTFKKPGRYAYYCTFHGSPSGGQRGVVVVKPAAPTTTTTTAPTSSMG